MVTAISRRRGAVTFLALLVATLLVIGLSQRADAGLTRKERMLRLINTERVTRDKGKVGLSARLSRIAREHSKDMAARGEIYHSTNLVQVLSPYRWSIGGENVGAGYSVESLHTAFMKSTPHRKNVLRRAFDHVGIGFVKAKGALWVTLIFWG